MINQLHAKRDKYIANLCQAKETGRMPNKFLKFSPVKNLKTLESNIKSKLWFKACYPKEEVGSGATEVSFEGVVFYF